MLSSLLSDNDKIQLKSWIDNKDKPLFITGYDGCGKSYWANELLKDYHIITINSEHLKYKDINNLLHLSIFKKDIFMMISPDIQYKALIVDDVQMFIQTDKTTLVNIHKFIHKLDFKRNPVIFVCNESIDKHSKSIKLQSYVIEIKFNHQHYINIMQNRITNDTLNSFIKQTKNLNTILSSLHNFNHVLNDKVYSNDNAITNMLTKDLDISELIRVCSTDYTILSLNIIENIPLLIKNIDIGILCNIYKSVVYSDYIDYKYIQHTIDIDIRAFYACVIPTIYCVKCAINMVPLKYNSYISRSIIQVHNQNILNDDGIKYLNVIKNIYLYMVDVSNKTVPEIDISELTMKTLEKQMKVFNYYYNKNMNKNQLTNFLKSIS